MLKNKDSSAIVAVSDLARAREFYAGTLGLKAEADSSEEDVLTFRTGRTSLIVYRSDEAGSNRANAAVWGVGDELDDIAAALKAKGVAFEHYPDMEGIEIDGDVHVAGDMRLVWFKDPDGNILHLNNM